MSLNLAHYLEIAAIEHAAKTAVRLDDFEMTYSELAAMARRVSRLLRDKGIERGDKVAIMAPNIPQFTAIYFGILHAGATVVPVNNLLKSHEIAYYLEDSDALAFFAWKGFYDEAVKGFNSVYTCRALYTVHEPGDMDELPDARNLNAVLENTPDEADIHQTMPDDTAVLLYTSGTTGHPKGAELTHFNMFYNALYTRDHIAHIQPDDVALAILPLFHSFGQTVVQNASILAGATLTMLPSFDTYKALEVIQRDRVTFVAAVPTMYFFMLNASASGKYDLSSIRMAISGGAALPVEVLNRFEERFKVRILEGYGLSETSPVASFNVLKRPSKPGSIGLPLWGCDMRIMRDDGSFADVGEVGEIVIRGHNIMKGYYKKPAATEEAIVDGWFHSGDLAYVDAEGYFFIVDRKKDVIIRGGMNIYPREIEEVLYAHPDVLEVSVVGIPDEARGEEVKAFVSLRPGSEIGARELRDYCRERMARYKCPREIEILDALPKGPTGKILKRELRVRQSERQASN